MANTPKKMKDPTEAALSAIQDALSVRDNVSEPEPAPAPTQPAPSISRSEEPVSEPPWRTVRTSAPVHDDIYDDEVRAPGDDGAPRRPANDDRESIGQILRTLQHRPTRTSYLIATVFAGLWMLAWLVLGCVYLPQIQAAVGPTGLTAPVMAVLFAAFFVPVIFFPVPDGP